MRQLVKCFMTESCSNWGVKKKKELSICVNMHAKINHFRVNVMKPIILMMWKLGSGLGKMCVFYFYHFFMITAIVCVYSMCVRVRVRVCIKLYVHFILSFKTDCNFILG